MSLLVSTMNDVPGWRVDRVLGECTGLTVRSRNVGAQLGAGFKAMVGGELKGLTKQLQDSRDEAMRRMVEVAAQRGANAVLAMRFDSNEVGAGYQELVAYGTAVVLVPADQAAQPAQPMERPQQMPVQGQVQPPATAPAPAQQAYQAPTI
jgi:uncharacterized protein YbjQ (UPF0145 family)